MDKLRYVAIEILEEFEELLESHEINIPDEDREGNISECRIYGRTYYNLEDKIVEILGKLKK